MKALLKFITVILVALIMGGCAGHMGTIAGATAGAALNGTKGALVGGVIGAAVDNQAQGHVVQGYGGGLRAAPCQPFHAEELMAWATELENSHQKRNAQVTNSNGRVSCYSSESAGSQSGGGQRGNVYRPSGQSQPQYRQAPVPDGVKYQQVEM